MLEPQVQKSNENFHIRSVTSMQNFHNVDKPPINNMSLALPRKPSLPDAAQINKRNSGCQTGVTQSMKQTGGISNYTNSLPSVFMPKLQKEENQDINWAPIAATTANVTLNANAEENDQTGL